MKIVIVEDEQLTAENLAAVISKIEEKAEVTAILNSVQEAVTYFQNSEKPDLIFCDIQLGDGLSFEIFKQVPLSIPIIFCTAFDEYALEAFKANGIEYLLKPFNEKVIANTFSKYKEFKRAFSASQPSYEQIMTHFQNKNQNGSILVYIKDKIVPVKISKVACFYIRNGITHLITFDKQVYSINKNLEELGKLGGENFYRANRKFLINRKAIKEVSHWFNRKLIVDLSIAINIDKNITVSKEKSTDFLKWLSEN